MPSTLLQTRSLSRATKIRAQMAKLETELRALHVTAKPTVTLAELHEKKSGRIDAGKVSAFLSIPLKRLAEGLELDYKAVHRHPAAAGWQEALQPVKRCLELLHAFFGRPETIRVWLNTPHPDLGGRTALETMLAGKAGAVRLILENAWHGVPV